jgi:3-phenylpropionate/trans-cinnamate dioxygenase ferredoxin reductase component
MSVHETSVIIGGGLAGAKAAETLRAEGFDGRIVLATEEDQLPYERPPLSKTYLAGTSAVADAQVHDAAFYAQHDVEVLTGTRAEAIDPAARRVRLAGVELPYDRLLLATGARPRRPPIAGADGKRVHTLRSLADADALRAAIGEHGRLIVVGAGWIGCEVAATARGLGAEVTMLEQAGAPLERVLGAELGRFFAEVHRSHGVEVLTSAGVAAIEDAGRRVRLTDGRTIECDAVLLGVGVSPATQLAEAAGLEVDDGIVADELLRASAPDVFVAGDVASVPHPRYGRRVRVEHWDNAAAQGAAAARSMLGKGEPYTRLPYFFSDQYELGLEYVGLHDAGDELVIRGALDDGHFQAVWVAPDGRPTAAMHVDEWDAIGDLRALVERGATVDVAQLRDPKEPVPSGHPEAA